MQMTGSLKFHQRRLEGGRKKESIVISELNGMYEYLKSNKLENHHPKRIKELTLCSTCKQETDLSTCRRYVHLSLLEFKNFLD